MSKRARTTSSDDEKNLSHSDDAQSKEKAELAREHLWLLRYTLHDEDGESFECGRVADRRTLTPAQRETLNFGKLLARDRVFKAYEGQAEEDNHEFVLWLDLLLALPDLDEYGLQHLPSDWQFQPDRLVHVKAKAPRMTP